MTVTGGGASSRSTSNGTDGASEGSREARSRFEPTYLGTVRVATGRHVGPRLRLPRRDAGGHAARPSARSRSTRRTRSASSAGGLGSDFDFVEVKPASMEAASAGRAESWIVDSCRPDLECDVVVLSGEFGGRFFGSYGFSLGLQIWRKRRARRAAAASSARRRRSSLLACNTLATKDQDGRTPRSTCASCRITASARRRPSGRRADAVTRPVGRASANRFAASSWTCRASTASRRWRHAAVSGADARALLQSGRRLRGGHVERAGRSTERNAALASAFTPGRRSSKSGGFPARTPATRIGLVCALSRRGRASAIVSGSRAGSWDGRTSSRSCRRCRSSSPATRVTGWPARSAPCSPRCRRRAPPATRCCAWRTTSEVSTLKLQVSHFALPHGLDVEGRVPRRIAIDGTELLARPLTSEIVDIVCEIAKHEPVGDAIRADDSRARASRTRRDSAGRLRGVDRQGVTPRLVDALADLDPSTRLWAAYALSRRPPLDGDTLVKLAGTRRTPPRCTSASGGSWRSSSRTLPAGVWRAIDPALPAAPATPTLLTS